MATNNSINSEFTNNADGFAHGGGTTKRTLTVTGADMTLTGSGSNTQTMPSSSQTLVGRTSTDTLTNKTMDFSANTFNGVKSLTEDVASVSGDAFLIWDAVAGALKWIDHDNMPTGAGGTPAGSNYEIQYNASGSFGAEDLFRYDYDTNTLVVGKASGEDTELTMDMFRNDTAVLGATNNAGVVASFSNDTAGDAFMKASANGVGDAGVVFGLNDTTGWVIGVDNSDSDKLKFNPAYNSLTSAVALEIDMSGNAVFTGDVTVPDEVYGAGWNTSLEVPTKNAVYNKIESLTLGDADQNLWSTITTDSGTSPVPDSTTDTLSILGGTGIDTVGDSGADSVTIAVDEAANFVWTGDHDLTNGSMTLPYSDTFTPAAIGDFGIDTLVTDFAGGVMKYYDGSATVRGVVDMPISEFTSPTDGHVVAYNGTNDVFELVAPAGGDPDQNIWSTVTTDSGTSPTPDTTSDALTIVGSNGITTVGDSTLDKVTVTGTTAAPGTVGVVDLATTAEIDAGTGDLALSVNEFNHSIHAIKEVALILLDDTTATAVGDGAGDFTFRIPPALNGMDLVSAEANVDVAGTTGTLDIQIHNIDNALDMLTDKIQIASGSLNSDDGETINATNDHVNTDDRIRIDIDAVHTTAAQGLQVTLGFRKP